IASPKMLTLGGNITLLKAGDINWTKAYTDPSRIYGCTAPCTTPIASVDGAVVELDAAYIHLYGLLGSTAPTLADGTFTAHATRQLDVDGVVSIANAAQVNLASDGDIRLTTNVPGFTRSFSYDQITGTPGVNGAAAGSGVPIPGMLIAPDNLTLTARQIYPTTDVAFLLMSSGKAPDTVTDRNGAVV